MVGLLAYLLGGEILPVPVLSLIGEVIGRLAYLLTDIHYVGIRDALIGDPATLVDDVGV